jgi:hypothetical protein
VSGLIGYDDLRVDTVRQVAKLMAAAAITSPSPEGQLILADKHLFIETVISDHTAPCVGWRRGCARLRQGAPGRHLVR